MHENVKIQIKRVVSGFSYLTLTKVGSEFSNFESFNPQSACTIPRRDSKTCPGIHNPRHSSWLSISSWWKQRYGPTSSIKHSVAIMIGLIIGSSNVNDYISCIRFAFVSAYLPPISSSSFFACVGMSETVLLM